MFTGITVDFFEIFEKVRKTGDANQTIVSIVGNEITETKEALKKIFASLDGIPVRMVSYGGSHHNISVLIPRAYKEQTLQALNAGLFGLA